MTMLEEPDTRRHPREAEILKYLEVTPFPKGRKEELNRKVLALLKHFAEHGNVKVRHGDNAQLASWLAVTKSLIRSGDASERLKGLINLLGVDTALTSKGAARQKLVRTANRGSQAAQKPEVAVQPFPSQPIRGGEMMLNQLTRDRLRVLAPSRLEPLKNEELAETVWWHWFWHWVDHVLEPGRAPMGSMLRLFVELQPLLHDNKVLSIRQQELVNELRRRATKSSI